MQTTNQFDPSRLVVYGHPKSLGALDPIPSNEVIGKRVTTREGLRLQRGTDGLSDRMRSLDVNF